MTRQEYMQQLAALLAAMPEAERRDALDYYEEYFDAAGPEKEAQTIQELGSPQNVAEKIWEGTGAQFGTPMPDNSMPEQGSRRRKKPGVDCAGYPCNFDCCAAGVQWLFQNCDKISVQHCRERNGRESSPAGNHRGSQWGSRRGSNRKMQKKVRMKTPKQPSQRKVQKAKAPTGWKAAR